MATKHEIFPQESFEQQTNGTVFYKEGKLNDFPYAGPGVFESWKYGFDAGKQTFRAENGSKVYERRLVKDQFGNPRWTGWMEVAAAEAHGIQAIAINDKPLQLPNTDGAIKLQITPESIGAYTKQEVYDLVNDKIYEDRYDNYIYVKWSSDENGNPYPKPIDVLVNTYPDGGEENKYYLVEPNPGTEGVEEPVTYWIWAEHSVPEGHKKPAGYVDGYYWVPLTDLPDMKAFVSYSVFDEHRFDDTVHVSQADQDSWNAKPTVEQMNKAIEDSNSQALEVAQNAKDTVEEHIRSYGSSDSMHVTAAERKNWNEAYNRSKEQTIPLDGQRYVGENGVYVKAFEQYGQSVAKSENLLDLKNQTYKDEATIATNLYETLFNVYNASNHVLTNVKFEATVHNPRMGDVWITTNGASELFSSADNPWTIDGVNFKSIDLPYATPFDEIHIHCSDNTAPIVIDFRIVVSYYEKQTINIGDENLTINLIGPELVKTVKEDGTTVIENGPLYNGQPLSELIPDASHTADWGRITGDISLQKDLDLKMADYLSTKLNNAPMDSTYRYDVYRDGLVRSLIQQTDGMQIKAESFSAGNLHTPEKRLPKGYVVIGDIKEKLKTLTESGYIPIKAKLSVEYVNCLQNEKLVQLPIYFRTDNDMIDNSPTVASGAFKWDWPGDISKEFDQIILEGNDAESLTNVNLVVQMYKPGNTVIEQPPTKEQPSGYNLTIKSKNFNNVVSGNLVETSTNKEVHLTGNNWETVSGTDTLNVEGNKVVTVSGSVENTVKSNVTNVFGANVTTSISGDVGENIQGDSTVNVSGDIRKNIQGDFAVNVSGFVSEDFAGSKSTVINNNLLENISGSHNYTVKGAVTEAINGNLSTTVSGTVRTDVGGNVTNSYEADVLNTIKGNYAEGVNGSKSVFVEKTLSVSANKSISVLSESINIGKEKAYGIESDKTISVYGQEIDSRFASKAKFEGEVNRLEALIEENTQKDNEEVYELQSGLAREIENRVSADLHIREDISGAYVTNEALETFSGNVDSALNTKFDKEAVVTGVEFGLGLQGASSVLEVLNSDEEVLSTNAMNLVYQLIDNRIVGVETKLGLENERWDLTINDSDELKTVIENGTFASSERILFKSGEYTYDGTTQIDFANVKFVKGEAPVTVNATNNAMPNPINLLGTQFETIEMNIGTTEINPEGAVIVDIQVTKDLGPVKLSKDNVIYKLTIVDDGVTVGFEDVIQGKEYTFMVDQTDQVRNVYFSNHFHNDTLHQIPSKEFGFGSQLEHQAPNSRTIINVVGLNENYPNGFVINNVIYGNQVDKNANIKLVVRNTRGTLLGSNVEAEAVVVKNVGERFRPNDIIEVHSKFVNLGWKESGNIITVTNEDKSIRLRPVPNFNEKIGAYDGDFAITKFEIDTKSFPLLADGTKEHVLYLDFEVAPAEVRVTLDPRCTNYVNMNTLVGFSEGSKDGQNKVYQPHYDKVNISFNMKDDYYLHGVGNGNVVEDKTQDSLPWEFALTSQDNIVITPKWYKNFNIVKDQMVVLNNEEYAEHELINGREMKIEITPDCSITDDERLTFKMAPITVVGVKNCFVKQHSTYCTSADHEDGVAHPDNQIIYVTPHANEANSEKASFKLIWADKSATFEFDIEKGFDVGQIKLRNSPESDPNTVLCLAQANNDTPDEALFNEYEIGVDWATQPSRLDGVWSSTDPKIAEVVSAVGNDTGVLVVKKKGTVKITFTPNAEPKKFVEKTFNVKSYASGIEFTNTTDVTTSQQLVLTTKWTDPHGNKLVDGTWSNNVVNITAPVAEGDVQRINVPNPKAYRIEFLPVPVDGGMDVPATADVVVNTSQMKLDTTVKPYRELATALSDTITFNIRPGIYQIGFDKDEHVLAISPSENLTDRGGNIFPLVRFQLENGYMLTSETIALLSEKLNKKSSKGEIVETPKVISDENGQLEISLYVPYGNVVIPLVSERIPGSPDPTDEENRDISGKISLRNSPGYGDPSSDGSEVVVALAQVNEDASLYNEYEIGVDWTVAPASDRGTWTSSDRNIAEVVSEGNAGVGKLIVKKMGKVTIKFTPASNPTEVLEKTFTVNGYASRLAAYVNRTVAYPGDPDDTLNCGVGFFDPKGESLHGKLSLVTNLGAQPSPLKTDYYQINKNYTITIFDKEIPTPIENTITMTSVANALDTSVKPYRLSNNKLTDTCSFTIKEAVATFTKGNNITSISPETFSADPGTEFELSVTIPEGFALTQQTLTELTNKFSKTNSDGTVLNPVVVAGPVTKITLYFPKADTTVTINAEATT